MTTQHLQLIDYNWRLVVFYNMGIEDSEEILLTLYENTCPNKDIRLVYEHILGKLNTGFTYSNLYSRTSIMGISKTSSDFQLINTIVHEIKHLQSSICQYYNIPEYTEFAASMAGNIAMYMYSDFKKYLK